MTKDDVKKMIACGGLIGALTGLASYKSGLMGLAVGAFIGKSDASSLLNTFGLNTPDYENGLEAVFLADLIPLGKVGSAATKIGAFYFGKENSFSALSDLAVDLLGSNITN